eukprot:1155926-Pelagomonas_calceolata.AAC.5
MPRTNSWYLLRGRGGQGENREHSALATATPPTFKARHPSQLPLEQRHEHLVEVKYFEDTQSKNQLEGPSSSTATSVTIFLRPQLKLPSIPFC